MPVRKKLEHFVESEKHFTMFNPKKVRLAFLGDIFHFKIGRINALSSIGDIFIFTGFLVMLITTLVLGIVWGIIEVVGWLA
jgi:hypothetical protein